MNDNDIQGYGDALFEALRTRRSVPPLTTTHAGISIDDAYAISNRLLSRRLEEGERVIGKKIGVTSEAVQSMLGVYKCANSTCFLSFSNNL